MLFIFYKLLIWELGHLDQIVMKSFDILLENVILNIVRITTKSQILIAIVMSVFWLSQFSSQLSRRYSDFPNFHRNFDENWAFRRNSNNMWNDFFQQNVETFHRNLVQMY